MSLTNYHPWASADRLQRQLERLFHTGVPAAANADWTPRVDIREEENRFVLSADLPGVEAGDVEITAEDGVLTIKGERRGDGEEQRKGYRRIERYVGRFSRRFSLPDTVDAGAITATSRNGVLELVLPKRDQARTRRINIDAA